MNLTSLCRKVLLIIMVSLSPNLLLAKSEISIVPNPAKVKALKSHLELPSEVKVFIDAKAEIDRDYFTEILHEIGITPQVVSSEKDAKLIFKLEGVSGAEAYSLKVNSPKSKNKITATASSDRGLIYALQSLRQIVEKTSTGVKIPACEIDDQPRFSWRAFMLDEARHFHGMTETKKLLDEMARLKMNVFHWHLVNDTGWRIEIKQYPLLTYLGSKRDFSQLHLNRNLSPVDWDAIYPNRRSYYTQEEIKEVVNYAKIRGIDVMPEIEMPGHASAAIYAYNWLGTSTKVVTVPVYGDLYNVTDPKVEKFLYNVLDEVIELFPFKTIHIGGDEADHRHWTESEQVTRFMEQNNFPTASDLQVWAINRMSNYLKSKDCKMMGWNEITGDNIRNEAHINASQVETLAEGTIVHFWDGDVNLVNKAIEKGYDVVYSNRLDTYLDYTYEVIPMERAYNYNPVPEGIALKDQSKVIGTGCQAWGEFTPNTDRLYYQVYPRFAAYAETGWSSAENRNYEDFRNRFEKIENIWKEKGYLKTQLDQY